MSYINKYIDTRFKVGSFTRDLTLPAGNQVITGVGFAPKAIIILTVRNLAVGELSIGFGDGSTIGAIRDQYNHTANTWYSDTSFVLYEAKTPETTSNFSISVLGTDGFTLAWTKDGSPSGTATINYLALR